MDSVFLTYIIYYDRIHGVTFISYDGMASTDSHTLLSLARLYTSLNISSPKIVFPSPPHLLSLYPHLRRPTARSGRREHPAASVVHRRGPRDIQCGLPKPRQGAVLRGFRRLCWHQPTRPARPRRRRRLWCSAARRARRAVESCTNAAAKLQHCDSPVAILSVLQELVQQSDQHRCRNERLRSCLNPIVNVLYGLAFPSMDVIASLKVCRR